MQELFEAAEKVRKIKKERTASFRTQLRWGKFYKVVQRATTAMKFVASKPVKPETLVSPLPLKEDVPEPGGNDVFKNGNEHHEHHNKTIRDANTSHQRSISLCTTAA
jgi:hypothetical protein